MLPKDDELPPPADDYTEIEAAVRHGGWSAWERLPVWRRERLIAHELHRARRESYYREKLEARAKAKAGGKTTHPSYDPLAAIKAQWGVKY